MEGLGELDALALAFQPRPPHRDLQPRERPRNRHDHASGDDQLVLLAGDTSYTQDLMLDGITDGVANDTDTARSTLVALRALAYSRPTIYLPSYPPRQPAPSREHAARHRPSDAKRAGTRDGPLTQQ